MSFFREALVPVPIRRPEAVALAELVAAIEAGSDARIAVAVQAARDALHRGKVLDEIDEDAVRGHVGSYG